MKGQFDGPFQIEFPNFCATLLHRKKKTRVKPCISNVILQRPECKEPFSQFLHIENFDRPKIWILVIFSFPIKLMKYVTDYRISKEEK